MRRETGGDEHNKELEKKKRRFQIMSFPYLSLMCACSLSYVGPCSVIYTVARTVPDMGLSNDLAMVTKSQTASGVIAPVSCLFKSHGLCSERPVITAQQPSLTTHRQSVIKSERGRCNQHFPSNQPQNHCL